MADLYKGLKTKSPAPLSGKPSGGSVNKDATRSATAKNQASLGPRTA